MIKQVLTEMMHRVFSPRLMNLNGPSKTVRHSAGSALAGANVPLVAKNTVALRSWAHLTIWVIREQRVRE